MTSPELLPWWKILADNWRGRNGNSTTGDSVRNSCADELEKVAQRALTRAPSTVGVEDEYILPCDVMLPAIETPLGVERDTILKGCTLSALLHSLEKYKKYPLHVPTLASEKEGGK